MVSCIRSQSIMILMSLLYCSLLSTPIVLLVYSLSILHVHNSYSGVTSELSCCVGSDHQLLICVWSCLLPVVVLQVARKENPPTDSKKKPFRFGMRLESRWSIPPFGHSTLPTLTACRQSQEASKNCGVSC